jgi:hypothetical protein
VNPFVIDSQSGDTLLKLLPVYFEGEAYKKKRIKKGIQYPDSIRVEDISPVKNERLSIRIPYYFQDPEDTTYYLNAEINVVKGKKTVFMEHYSASRLRLMPFKMIDYPMALAEMELTEEFYEKSPAVIIQTDKGVEQHVLTPEEIVEHYFIKKQYLLNGKSHLSNGELYQLYSRIDDEAELDLITEVAYTQMIKEENYVKNNRMASYIANRKAMMNLKKNIYDLSVLEPFIDVLHYRHLNTVCSSDLAGEEYMLNRTEIVINQVYTLLALRKYQSVNPLCRMLYEDRRGRAVCDVYNAITSWNMAKVRECLINIGDNKAVLYTEIPELDRNDEAASLVDAMDDANPKKWYLKAILAARDEEKNPTTNGTPLYITYLRRCFKLDSKYKEYYTFDAQFSDKLRKLHPFIE